jgi:hypothetical protein
MKIKMPAGTMVALIGSVIARNLLPVKQCGVLLKPSVVIPMCKSMRKKEQQNE